jgi:hypothetical protein
MINLLNLAVPSFSLIFAGFARGKFKQIAESGLEWINFFLIYVSLPALFFRILAKTPFEQLDNPPFMIEDINRRDWICPRISCRTGDRSRSAPPGDYRGARRWLRQHRLEAAAACAGDTRCCRPSGTLQNKLCFIRCSRR